MEQTVKLFFGLPLQPQAIEEIEQWRRNTGIYHIGSPTPADNFHVTLAFLGSTPSDEIPALIEQVNQLRMTNSSALVWGVDKLGFFPGGIVYLTGSDKSARLVRLNQNLKAFESVGNEHELFVPHVTLCRRSEILPTVDRFEFKIEFDSFCLFESRPIKNGVKYHTVHRWLL